MYLVGMHVTQAIKDKAVLLPVEVNVVSVKDESPGPSTIQSGYSN